MTTHVLTLLREYVTSLTTSVTTMLIFIGYTCMFTLKAIKSYLRSYMIKTNLTLMVISYKLIQLTEGLFNKFHVK